VSEPETPPATASPWVDIPNAEIGVPFVYFDGASCHGTINGTIQIEVIARILVPNADGPGPVAFKAVPTARLRCSPAAARSLRSSIDDALKMAEQPQPQPAMSASKLN
jgi:hypothetical protein